MSDLYLWLVHQPSGRRFKLALGVNSLRSGASNEKGALPFASELDRFLDEGGYPGDGDYSVVLENEALPVYSHLTMRAP